MVPFRAISARPVRRANRFKESRGARDTSLGDLTTLLAHFGTPSGASYADGDHDVDLSDLTLLLARFGTVCS